MKRYPNIGSLFGQYLILGGGVAKVTRKYKAGVSVYARLLRDKEPRWVSEVVMKSLDTHYFSVKVFPHGPEWRRHWEQLRLCYVSMEDCEPGDETDTIFEHSTYHPMDIPEEVPQTQRQTRSLLPKSKPPIPEHGLGNLRRSNRTPKLREILCS